MALYDREACEAIEAGEFGNSGTGLPAYEELSQMDRIRVAGLRQEYEDKLDDRRNIAECERLRQLAEASARVDGVTGEYLPRYLDTFVATRERLAAEEAAERRA